MDIKHLGCCYGESHTLTDIRISDYIKLVERRLSTIYFSHLV